jgi:hypothetical protein
VPLTHDAVVRIEAGVPGTAIYARQLAQAVREVLVSAGGQFEETSRPDLIVPDVDDFLLEVLVCDGQTVATVPPRISDTLTHGVNGWVLPVMPDGGNAATLGALNVQNIAFWKQAIGELAFTVLARAGITSLDRRVFISYRRIDTEPMAGQLFDALSRLNFSVFLDTVSVDPGVDFQSRLFEQLADKSMVVLLHSPHFADSRWTMAEAKYVKDHALSLLVLKLPTVTSPDALDAFYRAGDVIHLTPQDLESGSTVRLTGANLDKIIALIREQHDRELISRLAALRQRTLDALIRNGVNHRISSSGASIYATAAVNGTTYSLFPTTRPPGLPELFDASTFSRDVGQRRIVVGNIASYSALRARQMDWTVDGRNVLYADVSMLDKLADMIKAGAI